MSFEYGLSSALNAIGIIQTLNFALKLSGITSSSSFFSLQFNYMACFLILILTLLLLKGIKDSILVNNIFTVCILLFFMYCNTLAITLTSATLMTPFFAGGIHGVMKGSAICFFGYTSFE
jgi:APA family basic amino acid/polyamine antiporter